MKKVSMISQSINAKGMMKMELKRILNNDIINALDIYYKLILSSNLRIMHVVFIRIMLCRL